MSRDRHSVCAYCGKYFEWRYYRPQKYCSNTCCGFGRPKRKGHNGGTFKTGVTPWNKGLVGFRLGHPTPIHVRQKMRDAALGDRGSNWRGGLSHYNENERRGLPYRLWREAVFERDDYTCQLCGDRSKEGHRIRIEADHIKPFSTHLRLDVLNGRTLCHDCHAKTETYGSKAIKASAESA